MIFGFFSGEKSFALISSEERRNLLTDGTFEWVCTLQTAYGGPQKTYFMVDKPS